MAHIRKDWWQLEKAKADVHLGKGSMRYSFRSLHWTFSASLLSSSSQRRWNYVQLIHKTKQKTWNALIHKFINDSDDWNDEEYSNKILEKEIFDLLSSGALRRSFKTIFLLSAAMQMTKDFPGLNFFTVIEFCTWRHLSRFSWCFASLSLSPWQRCSPQTLKQPN